MAAGLTDSEDVRQSSVMIHTLRDQIGSLPLVAARPVEEPIYPSGRMPSCLLISLRASEPEHRIGTLCALEDSREGCAGLTGALKPAIMKDCEGS
jgi:hypothetical protein